MVDDYKDRPSFKRDNEGGVTALHGTSLQGMVNVERDLIEANARPQASPRRFDAVISGVYAHAALLRTKCPNR